MNRAKFILEYKKGCWSMTELCEAFGISRKTGYQLLERYEKLGSEALMDRSRAPHSHPNKTPDRIAHRIIEARKSHPTWGVKKLLNRLAKRDASTQWPARSTAERILGAAGLIQRRKRNRRCVRGERRIPEVSEPNDLWCQDYKGWFRVRDGRRCDPYTLTDASSRFALNCTALVSPQLEDVQACLTTSFREYGLPVGILSDNGPPFGSTGLGGLTRLGVWLLRLGVTPYFIDPGRPEQNGRHERFHLTLKQETATPPKRTIRAQQMAFTRFLPEFNFERPHEALGMATPGEIYRPSQRTYPAKLPSWQYPDGCHVRLVRSNGSIKWHGRYLQLGCAFVGEHVGLDVVGDGVIRICLGTLPLGQFHEDSRKVIPIPS